MTERTKFWSESAIAMCYEINRTETDHMISELKHAWWDCSEWTWWAHESQVFNEIKHIKHDEHDTLNMYLEIYKHVLYSAEKNFFIFLFLHFF